MIPEKFISTTKVSPKQNQNQNQNSLLFISTIGILILNYLLFKILLYLINQSKILF